MTPAQFDTRRADYRDDPTARELCLQQHPPEALPTPLASVVRRLLAARGAGSAADLEAQACRSLLLWQSARCTLTEVVTAFERAAEYYPASRRSPAGSVIPEA